MRQAFLKVDQDYFNNIGNNISQYLALKQDPKTRGDNPHLLQLAADATIGASATVAIVLNEKLFVAACGDTRAVLCLQLPTGELKVVKLSVDHLLGNHLNLKIISMPKKLFIMCVQE